ncbi:MAG TPA: RsbRD N-terminal domain-containing protein [Nitrospirota bacterium]|nr:RsbRD N-terminal domain-containing protein [Nitrospirota bacterium]
MKLNNLLLEKKSAILKKWFDAVVESYPNETSALLKKQKAQFTNPVGYTLSEGLEHLFDSLLQGMLPDTVARFLDSIVRLRAIQEFTPSEAVMFIFRLKKVVRQELGNELLQQLGIIEELSTFESAVDDLALYAFDLYVQCREKIFELKANEAKNATFRLLQQARLIVDNQE